MLRPLFILSSLALPIALVHFAGWHALWVCALLSLCTLLFSTGRPGMRRARDDAPGAFEPTTSMARL